MARSTNEHGPSSDDEINVLVSGGSYGWPHVAVCNWSAANVDP